MMDGDNFRKNLRLQLDDNPYLLGLDVFKRQLEKEYFAKVSVRICNGNKSEQPPADHSSQLVIEMECNFELIEILYYLQKGNWGGLKASNESSSIPSNSAFKEALKIFRASNTMEIDVEELTLVLKDTVIVIKKIYSQSIGDQLGRILQTLAAHYVHFTRDLTETPYEIYLPVFEEEMTPGNTLTDSRSKEVINADDYYRYWALYFDSAWDARIYDLSNKSIISGDLQMLNH